MGSLQLFEMNNNKDIEKEKAASKNNINVTNDKVELNGIINQMSVATKAIYDNICKNENKNLNAIIVAINKGSTLPVSSLSSSKQIAKIFKIAKYNFDIIGLCANGSPKLDNNNIIFIPKFRCFNNLLAMLCIYKELYNNITITTLFDGNEAKSLTVKNGGSYFYQIRQTPIFTHMDKAILRKFRLNEKVMFGSFAHRCKLDVPVGSTIRKYDSNFIVLLKPNNNVNFDSKQCFNDVMNVLKDEYKENYELIFEKIENLGDVLINTLCLDVKPVVGMSAIARGTLEFLIQVNWEKAKSCINWDVKYLLHSNEKWIIESINDENALIKAHKLKIDYFTNNSNNKSNLSCKIDKLKCSNNNQSQNENNCLHIVLDNISSLFKNNDNSANDIKEDGKKKGRKRSNYELNENNNSNNNNGISAPPKKRQRFVSYGLNKNNNNSLNASNKSRSLRFNTNYNNRHSFQSRNNHNNNINRSNEDFRGNFGRKSLRERKSNNLNNYQNDDNRFRNRNQNHGNYSNANINRKSNYNNNINNIRNNNERNSRPYRSQNHSQSSRFNSNNSNTNNQFRRRQNNGRKFRSNVRNGNNSGQDFY